MKKLLGSRKAALGIFAGAALLSLAILVVTTVAALNPVPTLSFEGLRFRVIESGENAGSIQAMVDVCVENIPEAAGAYARIGYNPRYLNPSDKNNNSPIVTTGLESNNNFFQISPSLYAGENPFLTNPNYTDSSYAGIGQCAVDTSRKDLLINLVLDKKLSEKGEIKKGEAGESEEEAYYYFDSSKKKIVLSTLTFSVKAEDVQTIINKFSGTSNPVDGDYLLKVSGNTLNDWSLPYFYNNGHSKNYTGETGGEVQYRYNFEPTLISAKAAEPKVEVNAWQAFTKGKMSDLIALLQSRSPMVTTGYADGNVKNVLIKWGEEKETGDYKVYHYENGVKGDLVTDANYLPTGGTYLVEQAFYYKENDAVGTEVEKKFPLPIQAEVVVTPIKLTDVTADKLNKTYNLNSALINTIKSYSDLELPTEVRLRTDVVPGGVSLTMPITDWTPGDTGSMADLKNESGNSWPASTADTDSIGTYAFTAQPGSAAEPVTPTYTAAEVQHEYPWLTVAPDWKTTVVATRKIVADGGVMDPSRYAVLAETSDDGKLKITVERRTAGGDPENMLAGATFQVQLPGGEVIQSSWFDKPTDVTEGDYGSMVSTLEASKYYTIAIDPGTVPSSGDYRELTRRSINLGGWFAVSVQEQGMTDATDFIPVLAAPRANQYIDDKTYNFTGINAGLFSAIKPLGNTVTLPRGTYTPIDDAGVLLPEKSYGVTTTYDGTTGAEPGTLYTFAVDSWTKTSPGANITQYGPNAFTNALYGGYGNVVNKQGYTATVKTEAESVLGDGVLKLTYEGTEGSVKTDANGNVQLAVYDTRQYGYTSRQEYRFTLTNTGDTPITGIYIPKSAAGYFQTVGDGPAAYLPPHTSTTFTLTYRYGLEKNGNLGVTYNDTVSIRYDSTKAPLNFDAQFRVSAGPVRKVTVKLLPELNLGESMGTASLIVGEIKDPLDESKKLIDYTVSAPSYESGSMVYLSAVPTDEYEVEKVYYYKNNDPSQEMQLIYYDPEAVGAAAVEDGTFLYSMEMPTYNVTVYVKFKEPVYSKLRMTGLVNFAAADATETPTEYEVWQKKFSETELGEAVTDLDRMKLGAAGVKGFTPNVNQYLVVIPANATVDQVEVTLRKLVIQFEENRDILPHVEILLPGKGAGGADLPIYDGMGTTVDPSVHTSASFPAPDKGKSTYVMVRLSAPDEDNMSQLIYRYYYLEVARDTDEEVGKLGYGNSPYGMIMNATNISTADKTAAKQAFIDNGYRFDDHYRPTKGKDMTKRYDAGAWSGLTNYDLDEKVYFALLGQTCTEPGIAGVVDSSGRAVPLDEIHRTVQVELQGETAKVTLDMGTAENRVLPDFREKPDGSGNYQIVPGVYELMYTYKDYDGTDVPAFKRPFIILGAIGDMNADGWVEVERDPALSGHPSDLDLLQNRIKNPMVLCDAITLFRLRTCDVNADGNINNIDANALRYQVPAVPFYLSTGY